MAEQRRMRETGERRCVDATEAACSVTRSRPVLDAEGKSRAPSVASAARPPRRHGARALA
eukprot:4117681-Pleurochrysis_carterae.AAC.1